MYTDLGVRLCQEIIDTVSGEQSRGSPKREPAMPFTRERAYFTVFREAVFIPQEWYVGVGDHLVKT